MNLFKLTFLLFTLCLKLGLSEDNVTKTYTIERHSLSCTYTLEVVSSDANSLILHLVNDCTNLRYVNVTLFSDHQCKMLEVLSNSEVLEMFEYSLENNKMSLVENYKESSDILLTIVIQLGFTEKEVRFVFQPKDVKQKDLLNAIVRLTDQIRELKSFAPVLFKETWTGDIKVRSAGWQTIKLNYVSHNDSNIRHNPSDGSIILHSGVYIIQGKMNCHRVDRFVIKITDSISKTVSYKGLTGNNAWAHFTYSGDNLSTISPQRIIIDEITTLYLRLWVQITGWSMGDSGYPKEDPFHSASVTVQQIA